MLHDSELGLRRFPVRLHTENVIVILFLVVIVFPKSDVSAAIGAHDWYRGASCTSRSGPARPHRRPKFIVIVIVLNLQVKPSTKILTVSKGADITAAAAGPRQRLVRIRCIAGPATGCAE